MARDLDLDDLPPPPKGLKVYNEKDTQADAWARILLMGPAKGGKTVVCARTAPGPVCIINCDGEHALQPAAAFKARYIALDAVDARSWNQAVQYACKLADLEKVSTIVVDTITLLADTIVEDLGERFEGFDLWREVLDYLVGGIRDLKRANAHLIVIAHAIANENSIEGVLPAIPGKAATRIPAMLHDWIWLDLDMKKDPPQRQFLVGPQKNWNHGARNARRTTIVPDNIVELLEELGIDP